MSEIVLSIDTYTRAVESEIPSRGLRRLDFATIHSIGHNYTRLNIPDYKPEGELSETAITIDALRAERLMSYFDKYYAHPNANRTCHLLSSHLEGEGDDWEFHQWGHKRYGLNELEPMTDYIVYVERENNNAHSFFNLGGEYSGYNLSTVGNGGVLAILNNAQTLSLYGDEIRKRYPPSYRTGIRFSGRLRPGEIGSVISPQDQPAGPDIRIR